MQRYTGTAAFIAPSVAAIPYATITVYAAGTTSTAALFSDTAGTVPLGNPFSANAYGQFDFCSANGKYDVVIALGAQSMTIKDVILFDLASFTSGALLFAGSSGSISQDPTHLSWDNVNKLLSINGNVLTVPASITLPTVTAAGQLPYGTAAGVLGVLAATGMADKKLFGNAAGTAPEWSSGMKLGTLTHDVSITGNISYTGVGFKPSMLVFLANIPSTSAVSIGFDDGTLYYAIFSDFATTPGNWAFVTGASIYLRPIIGNSGSALVYSMDTDGFTLSWSKASSPTGTATVYYLALR